MPASQEPHIRPRLELDHATTLRDLMKKIVVTNIFDGKLSQDEIDILILFELKLTELIILSETRSAIRALKS